MNRHSRKSVREAIRANLGRNIVYAVGAAEFDILHCLVVGETFAVEGDEAMADRPRLHRIVEDHVVAPHDDLKLPIGSEAVQDVCHRLRFCLLLHGTDSQDNFASGGVIDCVV